MQVRKIFIDDRAVSSAIGVVLMVAVAVVLAAAVGTFALGLAADTTDKTPSSSVKTDWGQTTIGGSTYDTVDITVIGGDDLKSKYVTVQLEENTVWNDDLAADAGGLKIYNGKSWGLDEIKSGDTLGLREDTTSISPRNEIKVIWNNGQKSQILGTGIAD